MTILRAEISAVPLVMKKLLLLVVCMFVSLALAPRKISWVAIGDSITYLNDHQDETGNRVTKGYMTLISEKYPRVTFTNQGHNGWTSINIADKIEELGLAKADVYTVFLGTNDWWQGKPLGSISNYQRNTGSGTVYGAFGIIVRKLKQLNKKARIILITPMQRGDFVYINNTKNNAYGSYKDKNGQTLEQFANAIVEIGKLERIPVVDLYHDSGMNMDNIVNFKKLKDPSTGEYRNYNYPDFATIPFRPETDEYPYPPEAVNMTYDGLHPSDKGYQVIADMLSAKWKGLK
jgi:lysophospholipase L1-like esterase